ncbi:hypothetical protein Pst134EA_024666 [Puccinia striiformis f. sp. tritici]|uniref:hypothetical protein n=1 Tax=Puccinia striiformis f. sp. tritici TaxID=168172 RepID=UPI002007E8A0|nr:hypothetical protein Pst134EA_024666 [Puccinia striiformis f. sp. tritici]KAH9453800.1 hypothetical protein Pst134EA_024666 [Puccinia striiformis f. sp. tritici]
MSSPRRCPLHSPFYDHLQGSFVRLRFNIQIRLERLTAILATLIKHERKAVCVSSLFSSCGSVDPHDRTKNKRHLVRRTGGLSQAYTSETSPAGSGRQTYYQNAKNRGVASRAKKHLGSGEVLSQASGKLQLDHLACDADFNLDFADGYPPRVDGTPIGSLMGILPGLMGLGEYRSTGRVWGTRRRLSPQIRACFFNSHQSIIAKFTRSSCSIRASYCNYITFSRLFSCL